MRSHLAIPGLRTDLLQQAGAVSFGISGTRSLSRTTRLPPIDKFTLCGWIYRLATPGSYQQIITFGANDTSTNYYALYCQPSVTSIVTWNGASEAGPAGATPINTWTHIALTVNPGGANQCLAYVNGVLTVTNNQHPSPTLGRIMINDAPDAGGSVFQGAYAWWSVYDRPLSADEIKLHMANPWHPALAYGLNTMLRFGNESNPGEAAFGQDFIKSTTGFLPLHGPPIQAPPIGRRVFYLIGAAPDGAMSGTSDGVATAAGALTGTGALSGTSAGAGTGTAALTGAGAMSGTAAGSATATLTNDTLPASGTTAGTSTATGALTGTGAMSVTAAGAGAVTAALTGAGAMSGTSAGSSTALASADGPPVPIVQYRLDEASSGQAPTDALDSRPSPLNLAFNYVGGTPAYGSDANGRHLVFAGNVDEAVAASVALDTGNKVFDAIDGTTGATLEVVANLDFPMGVTGDIADIFGIGQDDGENDVFQIWTWEGSQQHIEVSFTTTGGYPSGYYKRSGDIADIPAGVNIFHAIIDTDNATEADRIRLYCTPIGGSRSRITLATSNDGTGSIPQHAQIDVPTPNNSGGPTGPNHTQHVLIGNWIDYFGGNGGVKGKIYYAAIYGRVLTGAEMDSAPSRITDSAAAVSGTTSGAATVAGALTGAGAMSGTSAGATTTAGALVGAGAMSGTSSGAGSTASTLVGIAPVSGTSNGTSTTAGALTGAGEATGTAAGVTTVAGALTGAGAMSGTSPGTSTATGAVVVLLSGLADGVAAVAGTLTGAGAMSGASSGSSTAVLQNDPGAGSGTTAGVATVAGALTGTGAMAGTAAGTTTTTATAGGAGAMAGQADGTTTTTAALTGDAALSGSCAGVADVAGNLDAIVDDDLSGSAAGTTTCTASLTGAGAMSGTSAGTSTATLSTGGPPTVPSMGPGSGGHRGGLSPSRTRGGLAPTKTRTGG